MLRSIAAQLLRCLADRIKDVLPAAIEPYLNVNNQDSTRMEDLIEALLMELPQTFIFVDGLDEAEYAEDVSDFGYHDQDVQEFVGFLLRKAAESSATVRLWCSSQDLPTIHNYLEKNNAEDIQELPAQVKEVQEDIIRYLSSAMPVTHGGSGLPQAFIRATLETEVEGSFRWAKHMLHEMKSLADDDDMLDLVTKVCPER
ncbi:hypothetical protein BDV06DRAFT_221721 [Aspergillus oleicola]